MTSRHGWAGILVIDVLNFMGCALRQDGIVKAIYSCLSQMWGTPIKQGTSNILGKMSFWYHCKEHTYSFNLIPKSSSQSSLLFEIWPFMCETFSIFSGSVISRNRPLKLPNRLRKIQIFLWENVGKSFRNYFVTEDLLLRYVKNQKSQNQQMSHFHPVPTSIAHISK